MLVSRIHLGNVVLARSLAAASVTVRDMEPTSRRAGKLSAARRRWLRRVLRIRA